MSRLVSLATCALIVTAFSFGLPGAATSILDGSSAWTSGRDAPDDGPEFDDYDNSGPGNGDWECDDNDDYDPSSHGGGDDFDDEPGVLAIPAIDADGPPYIRANRGDYIDFAAFGVGVPLNMHNHAMHVTGTSFAAPVIAARVAKDLRAPSPTRANAIIADLQRRADGLGEPGHHNILGWDALRD